MKQTLKFSEDLPKGYVLELHGVCYKPRILKDGVFLTGLSISLRYYYDRKDGFVTQKVRTPQECLLLARKWANTRLEKMSDGG